MIYEHTTTKCEQSYVRCTNKWCVKCANVICCYVRDDANFSTVILKTRWKIIIVLYRIMNNDMIMAIVNLLFNYYRIAEILSH